MNQVAKAAGVTKPVLYQHFRSKRELYREVLEDVGGRLEEAIVKATADAGGPHQQVEAGFRTYFRVGRGRAGRVHACCSAAAPVPTTSSSRRHAARGSHDRRRRRRPHRRRGPRHDAAPRARPRHRRHRREHEPSLGRQRPPLDPEDLAAQTAGLAWAGLRGIRPPLTAAGAPPVLLVGSVLGATTFTTRTGPPGSAYGIGALATKSHDKNHDALVGRADVGCGR